VRFSATSQNSNTGNLQGGADPILLLASTAGNDQVGDPRTTGEAAPVGVCPPSAPPPGGLSISLTRVTVDMPLEKLMGPMNGRTVTLDGAKIRDGTFENCRIIFKGEPTVLIRITFINCVFEFPAIDQPPPPLKRMSRQLLAQNMQHVLIESL
jgi:hypothetical protein